jgi:hypothetical protein
MLGKLIRHVGRRPVSWIRQLGAQLARYATVVPTLGKVERNFIPRTRFLPKNPSRRYTPVFLYHST